MGNYHIVRYLTGEVYAAFAEHAQAVAAARDLGELHREPFVIRAALQYDSELLTLAGSKARKPP